MSSLPPRDSEPALLRPTRHPDIRCFRTHWSSDWLIFTLFFGASAFGFGYWVRPVASIPFAGFALLTAYVWALRTTVDRRRRAFAIHLPWSPWALDTTHPVETLRVERYAKTSKGHKTVYYRVMAGDRIVADGMTEPGAHELAEALGQFLELRARG